MMKCAKSKKNPCKICFQTVTKRNGLRCEGACHKWVHYTCLNYTPGKIKDIKAGFIKILCPSPDCSSEPKELLANPPYTCSNKQCPANNFPKCESAVCAKNKGSSDEKAKSSVSFPKTESTKPRKESKSCSCLLSGIDISNCSENCKPECSQPIHCKEQDRQQSKGQTQNSFSDTRVTGGRYDNTSVINALEQMCNTVTLLSKQINLVISKLAEKSNRP